MTSETPRTEAAAAVSRSFGDDLISADFARQLERELAAKEAELTEYRNTDFKWNKHLQDELAESRAQVARCNALFSRCIEDLEENLAIEGRLSSFVALANEMKKCRASLPEQSARDVEVLMAAEELVEHPLEVDTIGWWQQYEVLRKAVRGDKT